MDSPQNFFSESLESWRVARRLCACALVLLRAARTHPSHMSAIPDSDSGAPSLDGERLAFMKIDADERAAVSKLVGKAVWANSTWLQRILAFLARVIQ